MTTSKNPSYARPQYDGPADCEEEYCTIWHQYKSIGLNGTELEKLSYLKLLRTQPRPARQFITLLKAHPWLQEQYDLLLDKPPGAFDQDELPCLLLPKFQEALCTSDILKTLEIRPRSPLLGKWMKEGDLGFVFGPRGSGKTWFTYLIAFALSTGVPLHGWNVPGAVDVLLVDGEMPLDDCRDRLRGLDSLSPRLHLLHHEMLFDRSGLVMNLTDRSQQRIVTALCLQTKAKVLILDNLSCLFSGIKENDADAWELVLNWLLDLRRRRIAVLIIHHTGHDGQHMRGTSKREDAAFWVIAVKALANHSPDEKGTRFETVFTKQRNSDSRELPRRWILTNEPGRTMSHGCVELTFDEKVLTLIQDGLRTASDIALELGVVKSTVSKAVSRLERDNLIERTGKGNAVRYEPRGFMRNGHTSK